MWYQSTVSHLVFDFLDPVHLVPELVAGGPQAGQGLLQGGAGMAGPLLHDLAQPDHSLGLRPELQLVGHRLIGIQHLLGRQQGEEEVAVACRPNTPVSADEQCDYTACSLDLGPQQELAWHCLRHPESLRLAARRGRSCHCLHAQHASVGRLAI